MRFIQNTKEQNKIFFSSSLRSLGLGSLLFFVPRLTQMTTTSGDDDYQRKKDAIIPVTYIENEIYRSMFARLTDFSSSSSFLSFSFLSVCLYIVISYYLLSISRKAFHPSVLNKSYIRTSIDYISD